MNNPGICRLSVVPVRSEASDGAEICTQLLFGEMVDVLGVEKSWAHIRCEWDGMEGWMDVKQLKFISAEESGMYKARYACAYSLVSEAAHPTHFLPLTMGATLPLYDGINLRLGDEAYSYSGQAIEAGSRAATGDWILKIAQRYLYAPYLWGGRSPFGIDCSGFTQVVYKMVGLKIKRNASEQVEEGEEVGFIEETQAGDLAFFENDKGKVIHVGIVMGENQIIHASGRVRIDRLDHFGIFNEERNLYSHQLRVVKRFIDKALAPVGWVVGGESKVVDEKVGETALQFKLF